MARPRSTRRSSRRTRATTRCFLVLGPWHHGQEIGDCSTLGSVKWNSDTGLYFRDAAFCGRFSITIRKDDAPKTDVPPVSAFETGTNRWLASAVVAFGMHQRLPPKATPLYLSAGLSLNFSAPKSPTLRMTNMFLIRRGRCRFARVRFSRLGTVASSPGRSGWSTISARRPGVLTLSLSRRRCCASR